MGLKKLITDAAGNVIGAGVQSIEQAAASAAWKEYFQSGDMSQGVLMKRAEKVYVEGGKNNKTDDNLISNGSGIDIQDGQAMIFVNNGQIVEFCAEPGRYTYESETAPSFIPGEDSKFSEALKSVGKEILNQWSAGGQRFSSQKVFFINMCELVDYPILWNCNNIGFHHSGATGEQLDIMIKGDGTLTIKISDPLKFYQTIGAQFVGTDANILVSLDNTEILTNAKAGILDKISESISALGAQQKVAYTMIGAHAKEIREYINNDLSQEWAGKRGFEVCDFRVNGSFEPTEDFIDVITDMQRALNMGVNANAANYDIQKIMAEGVKAAGENGGASGMMGIGLGMGAIGNAGLGQIVNQNPQPAAPVAQAAPVMGAAVVATADTWTCSCGTVCSGNFCNNCGSKKPEAPVEPVCAQCGTKLPAGAKFCNNCGAKVE